MSELGQEHSMTLTEAANLPGVSVSTLRRWSNIDMVNCCYIGSGRDRRCRLEDVVEFQQQLVTMQSRRGHEEVGELQKGL